MKGGLVSWQSRLQKDVALSTIEVELGIPQEELHSDNQSVIYLGRNAAYNSRTKHIQRRYHWLRDRVEEKDFSVVKIHMEENGSNMLMKVLPTDKLNACQQRYGRTKYPIPE